MTHKEVMDMNKKLLKVVYSALFIALTCVATLIIRIPSVGSVGYVNIGDTMVLICGWLMGGVYGALAAGLGSALADLLAGYAYYIPGTFVIKFLMAFAACIIYKKIKNQIAGLIVSGIAAEVIMIAGYFGYKALFLGKGVLGAIPSVISNTAQGVTCLVLGVVVFFALDKARFNQKFVSSIS